ncbi:MAG: SIS domain-containing protein [Christensenellales bacterium]
MDAINAYLNEVTRTLQAARDTQHDALQQGARMMADAALAGHSLFAFGCSHAGLLALELYYRTGGMALINPIRAPGLNLDVDPATMTSQMERLPGYGRVIVDHQPIQAGDVVIIHSVSGRNPVPVDVALRVRELGGKVIALTSMAYTTGVPSRHPSGQNLYQVANIVIDNCGCPGDGAVTLPGLQEKVGPTSTAVGAALLNAMMTQAVQYMLEAGATPPVFMSANVEGGDKHNQDMLREYGAHIYYMGHI